MILNDHLLVINNSLKVFGWNFKNILIKINHKKHPTPPAVRNPKEITHYPFLLIIKPTILDIS